MIKPFRIDWELIEFGLQALFLYGLAIILCIGLITYVIVDNKEKLARQPKINEVPVLVEVKKTLKNESIEKFPHIYEKAIIEKEKECARPAGCVIREDGTVEW